MSEEKKEITKYYLYDNNGESEVSFLKREGSTTLVEESEYKKLAGENKALKYELQKLSDLVDQKNMQIDQFSDEKQVVPLGVFEEVKTRLEICRKKLKKLGSYAGE